nr:uncharacterized protein LOC112777999 [Arachis hypogaea]
MAESITPSYPLANSISLNGEEINQSVPTTDTGIAPLQTPTTTSAPTQTTTITNQSVTDENASNETEKELVPTPRRDIDVGDGIFKCLKTWRIENKVFSVSVDNASYNDSCLRAFKDTISDNNSLPIGGSLFHVRFKIFVEIAENNRLKEKKLIIDCPTRWNSTYNISEISGIDEMLNMVREKEAIHPTKSELEVYLDESAYIPEGNSKSFSALEWWKNNSLKFKVLSKIAADPVFSAGGRVIDEYPSRLNQESIEAFICGGDWLRNKYAKCEPIPPITLELLLPLSVIDLTPSPPSISHRRRRNELRSHRRYRAALFHHRAATVSALKAPSHSSVPSSRGSPPFSVVQLCSIVAGAISVPFSFTWNTLIRAYARTADQKHKSMELYKTMLMMEREQQSAAVIPNNYTYRFVLKACAYLFSLSEGKQVNAHVLKLGFESDTHIWNSLIHFYATCGFLDLAHKVFEKMSERSEVSWNIMIDSYASAVSDEDAPNYHSIIQNPMDMVTMLQRVDNGWYITRSAFLQDIDLIVSIAKVYNGEDYNGAWIVSRACQLRDVVHEMISQMDPALVAYCDKIAAQGGPVHLSNELRGSTFPATPVVQLGTATRLSAQLRNVEPEVSVDQSYEALKHTKKSSDVARGAKDKSGQEPLPSKSQTQSTYGNLHGTDTNKSVHGSSLEDTTISDTELSTRLQSIKQLFVERSDG